MELKKIAKNNNQESNNVKKKISLKHSFKIN